MSAFGRARLSEWALDPAVTYLNHGTVGAPPRRVLAAQQVLRDGIERQPARFLVRELAELGQYEMRRPARLREAADAVGAFLGARGADLAFVDNATTGVNAVLRSLAFEPGDEILVTDHGYGAIAIGAQYVGGRAGTTVHTIELPHPRWESDAIVEAIAGAITSRTRLLIVDHVTSPTALVLPVAEIARRAHAADVPVLVDGAHAPGAIPLDLPALGVDWYSANLHKWAMAPRSCGILWASPERQKNLHPTVISWGFGLGLGAEFDWVGTRDPSPWLAAPEGIAFMRDLGLDAMRAWNHALAWDSARSLAERWNVELPQDESLVGSMVSVPLPERFGTTAGDALRLKDALLYEENVEAQVLALRDRVLWRISAQVYNEAADVERAARAIEKHAG